ncbi:MAG: hypothetical protein JNK82_04490 [Myxococcaceae bacterium]|nr:hypothetical protein [Myxococcaceae bacterium]
MHGTLVDRDARYSFAIVEGRTVAVGDAVGAARVLTISKGCVVLDDGEAHCMQPRAAAPASAAGADPGRPHFSLSRIADWAQARIVPVANGFKLIVVPKPAAELGVQAGDVLVGVNGRRADFSVLPLVQAGAVLKVELERNGQRYTLEGQLDP